MRANNIREGDMGELYGFKLADGVTYQLTLAKAKKIANMWPETAKEINARCTEIELDLKAKEKKRYKKDAFEPGWQENIRMYITCPFQYKRALKDLGLVEIGNEYIPTDETRVSDPMRNPEMIKAIIDGGTYLSGREVEALEKGEYLKDMQVL